MSKSACLTLVIVLAVLVMTIVVTPGGAAAATITRDSAGTLIYTPNPGANNGRVVLHQNDSSSADVTVSTYGPDKIDNAGDCTRSDLYPDEVVFCPAPSAIHVDLGDGDDQGSIDDNVTVPVTVLGGRGRDIIEDGEGANTLDGGPGGDTLVGGKGDDVLVGGDGNDELEGKGGRDRLDAGAGDDRLHPDGYEEVSADVVDGGPGVDMIDGDYSSRFSDVDPPLAITLGGGADDGRPGEGDSLINVEKIVTSVGGRFVGSDGADEFKLAQVGLASELIGGGGDDRLRAGDGPDRVDGGPGDDTLDAGFGDDVIVGGPGRDTIFGDLAGGDCGPFWCKYPYGNDTIEAVDGEIDSVTCGAGQDAVKADVTDVVAPDCETVTRTVTAKLATGRLVVRHTPRLGPALRGGLRVAVTGMPRGRLTLVARRNGVIVAKGTAKILAGGSATVRLAFTAKARRGLRTASHVTLTVATGTATLKITLRR